MKKTYTLLVGLFLALSINVNAQQKNDCNDKLKLKNVYSAESSNSGFYALKFVIDLDSKTNVLADLKIIVQLKNCNGTLIKIAIPAKYDIKTGYYFANQLLYQEKECSFNLEQATVIATNNCGTTNEWNSSTSKAFRNIKKALSEAGAEVEIK